jgi:hypothetical protein
VELWRCCESKVAKWPLKLKSKSELYKCIQFWASFWKISFLWIYFSDSLTGIKNLVNLLIFYWKVFEYRQGLGIFLLTTMSRSALGSTQPPIQWIQGAFFLGVKRPGLEADHSPPSSAEVEEFLELYLHSPNTSTWHGAQFEKKCRDKFTFTFLLKRRERINTLIVL